MVRREAADTILWNHYCKQKKIYGIFELKHCENRRFNFSAFEPHQIDSLMACEEEGLVWKLSDADQRKKPADMISVPFYPAYVVIRFPEGFVMIRITDFVKFMNQSSETFITYEDAKKIATKIIWI